MSDIDYSIFLFKIDLDNAVKANQISRVGLRCYYRNLLNSKARAYHRDFMRKLFCDFA